MRRCIGCGERLARPSVRTELQAPWKRCSSRNSIATTYTSNTHGTRKALTTFPYTSVSLKPGCMASGRLAYGNAVPNVKCSR